jgi:flagellar motility protein MotE (MotC chaperone)
MAGKIKETELPYTDNAEITDMTPDDIKKSKTMQKKKEKEKKREKKKSGFPVLPVVILLIIFVGVGTVLYFDLFGVREQYVMPYVRQAPLIGQFFPESTEAPILEGEQSRFATMTPDEIEAEITGYEYAIEQLEAELETAREQKVLDDEEITYLSGFESQIENYREVKERLDQIIVAGAGAEAYVQFFEEISPENAERLYQESVAQTRYNTEMRQLTAAYAEMDEKQAAASLDVMLSTQQSLCIEILSYMSVEDRAAVFDEMMPDRVALITTLMSPAEPTPSPLQTAPPLDEYDG